MIMNCYLCIVIHYYYLFMFIVCYHNLHIIQSIFFLQS